VSFFEPNLRVHAPVGVDSGTVALTSAHTSCLRLVVKERPGKHRADRKV
jgi:hypothetical protein